MSEVVVAEGYSWRLESGEADMAVVVQVNKLVSNDWSGKQLEGGGKTKQDSQRKERGKVLLH